MQINYYVTLYGKCFQLGSEMLLFLKAQLLKDGT